MPLEKLFAFCGLKSFDRIYMINRISGLMHVVWSGELATMEAWPAQRLSSCPHFPDTSSSTLLRVPLRFPIFDTTTAGASALPNRATPAAQQELRPPDIDTTYEAGFIL